MGKLAPPGGSWGGVDVVAVVVTVPRCLGPGGKEARRERQIGGIPCAAMGSLVWSSAMIMWVRQNPGAPDYTHVRKLNMYIRQRMDWVPRCD